MSHPNLSLREQVAEAIIGIIHEIELPRISLVTREPFEPDKIAITQFPAVLVQLDTEERETITMGQPGIGRRMGTMIYGIRGYVRGVELDQKRNELITGIETALDQDRYLGLYASGVTDSQLVKIEIVKRLPPLAEINIEFQVKYNYERGQA
jgi:hypothetical protein